MKILYVTHWYRPEMGATAARVSELAQLWAKSGHAVTVLTGFPNHPTGVVPPAYRPRLRRGFMRESLDGVRVVRTWIYPAANRGARERIVNYTSFFLSACLRGAFLARPDVIIGTSPQLLVGLVGWVLGRLKRCPFVFEVRDLWPESVVACGMGRPGSWLIRVLDILTTFLYSRADAIIVVTEAFRDRLIRERGIAAEKIWVIENGVDPNVFRPSSADGASLRARYGLNNAFVVSYVGMIGHAHGLDIVIHAARLLATRLPEARFVLVGDGAQRERLEATARDAGLTNVLFVGEHPRVDIPPFINASDVCLVHLRGEEIFKTVIPSKMLESMSCAKAVILGVDGQARQILERAEAGIFIKPDDAEELERVVLFLHAQPALRARLGSQGRHYVMSHFSRAMKAKQYAEILEALIKGQTEPSWGGGAG